MNPGDFIFLSASVPYRQGWLENVRPREIEEAVVSLARAVFARRGRLIFGGHPSISPLVAAVAAEYFPVDPERKIRPVVAFQSKLFEGKLPDETWDMYKMGFAAIEWTPNLNDRNKSLTEMRQRMLGETSAVVSERNGLTFPRAMVGVGGMEGILEEAAIFRQRSRVLPSQKPPRLYVLESCGGAASCLLQPVDNWKQKIDFQFLPTNEDKILYELESARRHGEVLGLENCWRAEYAEFAPKNPMFQPYASMTQWLADTLDR